MIIYQKSGENLKKNTNLQKNCKEILEKNGLKNNVKMAQKLNKKYRKNKKNKILQKMEPKILKN